MMTGKGYDERGAIGHAIQSLYVERVRRQR
jgi:hypothetical protein